MIERSLFITVILVGYIFIVFHTYITDPAIWNSDKKYHVAEFEDTQIVIQCPVCANPSPEYQWYFNGTDFSSEIKGATMENFTVSFANDSSFGFYYCEATNSVSSVIFPVELRELGMYAKKRLK